ncbi:MAG TPA: metallophosphoesterase [Candidatus Eisenbacteria bacterium]|nr:metallophosphoesterase [Candidatus Eisenbacteria bacterium]
MRILAAADIHGSLEVYQWLIEQTPLADVLVLAGDLFDADFEDQQRLQAEKILKILFRSSCPVFYVMGNDDNVALEYADALIKPLHGRRVEVGGYNFVGYQYTPPFVGEMFVKEDSEIAKDLVSLEPLVGDKTVLVTHTPAYGSLDLCETGNVGSRGLAEFLQRKPAIAHIHGHIHYRFGVEGHHFNVASAATCRAILIDLPSLKYEVIRRMPE